MTNWPDWWSWEIESSEHVRKRMLDRHFNETDLRFMLEEASSFALSLEPGRWIAITSRAGRPWKVVLEPNVSKGIVVVVTAFAVRKKGLGT